jgi:hypothetical protein
MSDYLRKLHLRDDLEDVLRARHRRNCWHEGFGSSGGICARCDAEAVVDSPEFAKYVADRVAEALASNDDPA